MGKRYVPGGYGDNDQPQARKWYAQGTEYTLGTSRTRNFSDHLLWVGCSSLGCSALSQRVLKHVRGERYTLWTRTGCYSVEVKEVKSGVEYSVLECPLLYSTAVPCTIALETESKCHCLVDAHETRSHASK
jgi:hypothetical protein